MGGASLLCYLFLRHNNYSPPTFMRMMQMAAEAASPTPPTNRAGLPLTGPLQSTPSLPSSTVLSASPSPASSRLRNVVNVIRTPARFYMVNLLVGAAVLGAGTSVGQRLICGKIKQKQDKRASMK